MKPGIYGDRLFLPYLHAPGGQWTDGTVNHDQQIFSFEFDGTGEVLHFCIQQLLRLIAAKTAPFDRLSVIRCDLDPGEIQHVISNHGIEPAGVDRVDNRLHEPGILCALNNGTRILVDGNHRYVARYRAGLHDMMFYELSPAQWRLSLLDLPDDIGRVMARNGSASVGESA